LPGKVGSDQLHWHGLPDVLAFSTENYRPTERFEAFTEELARRVMSLDEVRRRNEGAYHAQVDVHLLGPLVCSRLLSAPVHFERVRPREDDESVLFSVHLKGLFQLNHRDMSWDSREDFASLTTDAHLLHGGYDGEALAVRIPHAMLAKRLPSGRAADPARIPRDSHLARLLGVYLNELVHVPRSEPHVAEAVAGHIVDLVALAMGPTREAGEAIATGGLRDARRRAVLEGIAKGYLAPDLSPDAVARDAGISERYLRQLLEEIGTTFTDLVLEQRLDHARRALIDPGRHDVRITDIAYDAGFSDLSYFNRAFRRRYGATPSDVRAQAFGR
jgi:AraC-like DNA-binding protein